MVVQLGEQWLGQEHSGQVRSRDLVYVLTCHALGSSQGEEFRNVSSCKFVSCNLEVVIRHYTRIRVTLFGWVSHFFRLSFLPCVCFLWHKHIGQCYSMVQLMALSRHDVQQESRVTDRSVCALFKEVLYPRLLVQLACNQNIVCWFNTAWLWFFCLLNPIGFIFLVSLTSLKSESYD